MQTLKQQLPPLEPLIAFESAVRYMSFTAAAKELSLSQAAVSQQIRHLEKSLGFDLFTRSHRSIQLTAEGMVYRYTVSAVLNQLATATSELKQPTAKTRLTLAADQSIASMWLIPRLPSFQQLYPDITVRLIASDIEQDCLAKDIDIAIIHGSGDWSGFQSEVLFAEEVFPVCSPEYLKKHQKPESLAALTQETLLNLESNHWNWMDWRMWLSSNDVHLPIQQQGLQINNYPLLIEAAKNGQGYALGWRYLIDEHLKNKSLVKPFTETLATSLAYYLIWPNDEVLSPSIAVFRDWAREQINQMSE